MKVTIVAESAAYGATMADATGYDSDALSDADALAEFAGRACYKSWSKPNPATAANSDYLAHIIRQGHFSVLEHASVSFYIEGVSRALLLELERHRFLSFSVESQRYVDTEKSHPQPVIPPALADFPELVEDLHNEYAKSLYRYRRFVDALTSKGLKRKEAREAARAVLPNATPVDFLVTGNLRAWRDVLGKRWHVAADAEIRELAGLILDRLRQIAPHSVQDVPEHPYGK